MSANKQLPLTVKYAIQNCPLCGRANLMVAYGLVSIDDQTMTKTPDQGYSFCNCKNIWYTNWKNINQTDYYDEHYSQLHYRERYRVELRRLFNEYYPLLQKHGNGGNKLLDVGCIVDFLVDAATEKGYDCTGFDVEKHALSKCKFIVGDLDVVELGEKYDVIFFNHVIEHLHYPLKAITKLRNALNDGGLLFVSAPDPFQVNWEMPDRWCSWAVRQHYIMWDMDSLVDEFEERGFTTLLKKRNLDYRWLQDYHLLFKK